MPLTLVDMVCAAREANRPVTVGVEFGFANQTAIDAFLISDGGPDAVARLLDAPAWRPDWADGRSSQAMLRLLDWLRDQHQSGSVTKIIAFDPDTVRDGADREAQMARRLRQPSLGKNGIFIVLTGSYHARTRLTDSKTTPYRPMAMLLPRARTVSIRIDATGGRSWSCTEHGCGENDVPQIGHPVRRLSIRPTPDKSYDGIFHIGTPVTPSPPVKQTVSR